MNLLFRINYRYPQLAGWMKDETSLRFWYRSTFGTKLDLNRPKTFNEKLQWLKLYDRKSIYTTMVDKYAVKEFVADRIGEEHIIPTLGVWDRFEDIDFDSLPERFVLKCTHDSGGLVICRDKSRLDKKAAEKKIGRSLKKNFFLVGREWPYKDVKPRIIAEKFMEQNADTHELNDYKFFCFNGVVKCFKVDFDRYSRHRANYYDKDANLLPFGEVVCPPNPDKKPELPGNLDTMIQFAEDLSADVPFLRVDFYSINGQIYFGELTFFPASGFGKFVPSHWDLTLGGWLELPTDA